jgi:hypothetical protein
MSRKFLEKYRTDVLDSYRQKLKTEQYLCGLPMHGDEFPFDISESDLKTLMGFLLYQYDNDLESNNWDQDLMGVLLKKKPLAWIDNDFYPRSMDKHFDYHLRFVAVSKMGMCCLNVDPETNNDPTNLYFWPSEWKNACLIYMFHEALFDDTTMKQIEKCFCEFHGILLGYSMLSSMVYMSEIMAIQFEKKIPTMESEWMGFYQKVLYPLLTSQSVQVKKFRKRYANAEKLITECCAKLTEEDRIKCVGWKKG